MPHFTRRTPVDAPAEALYAWHARPGALARLSPPWLDAEVLRHTGVDEGDEAVIRLGLGPAKLRWVAEHYDHVPGVGFRDVQAEGPFAHWVHSHRFLPDGPARSILEDEIKYGLPLAPLSTAARPLVGRALARAFAYRHRVTKEDVERHHAAGLAPTTVAITGATGLLGSALAAFLLTGGHRVVRLVRSREDAARWDRGEAERAVYWNVERGEVDLDALDEAAPDVVVHLAGEALFALRWTNDKKRRIWESRTKGTQLLARALARLGRPPRLLLSGSASGYYGDQGSAFVTEAAAPGEGFLAAVVQAWEASTAEAERAGIRTVHLRSGVVLTPAGGMLGLLLPLFRAGLGGYAGDGRPFLPWIALDDWLYAVLHLMAHEVEGPVNLSAPTPVTSRRFAEALGGVLRRPAVVPAPGPLLRVAGGEAARELALTSLRMLPQRLLDSGFTFAYPSVDAALRHSLGRSLAVPLAS
jgi:uncharacterized protein (TIGR01777 family)